jgi:hypothetical protein
VRISQDQGGSRGEGITVLPQVFVKARLSLENFKKFADSIDYKVMLNPVKLQMRLEKVRGSCSSFGGGGGSTQRPRWAVVVRE